MTDNPVQAMAERLAEMSPEHLEQHRIKTGMLTDLFAFFEADLIKAKDVPAWRAQHQEEQNHG